MYLIKIINKEIQSHGGKHTCGSRGRISRAIMVRQQKSVGSTMQVSAKGKRQVISPNPFIDHSASNDKTNDLSIG